MVSVRYANAMSEVLYYLKGIQEDDIKKIPPKFIEYLKENASKDYKCNFDYNKPLKDLELLNETRGIISIICLNYWCETDKQKKKYLNKLKENELKHEELKKLKYNSNSFFKDNNLNVDKISNNSNNETSLVEIKERNKIQKIFERIKKFFHFK